MSSLLDDVLIIHRTQALRRHSDTVSHRKKRH